MKIYFGAHDGKELKDVPADYLEWIIHQAEQQPPILKTDSDEVKKQKAERWRELNLAVEEELERRETDGDPDDYGSL